MTEPPPPDLYVKVQLDSAVKFSKLKSGAAVQGKLVRDVYWSDRKLLSAGEEIRLVVDHVEKRRRARNDHWPWVVYAFTPRRENYPVFKDVTVSGHDEETSLSVSLLSVNRKRDVHAQTKKNSKSTGEAGAVDTSRPGEGRSQDLRGPTMVLEAFSKNQPAPSSATSPIGNPETLPAGTPCKLLLLRQVSASKSKPGDPIRAQLLEPVRLGQQVVLPAGTIFEGQVTRQVAPRMLSRAGSLYLSFNTLTLPDGNRIPIAASLAGAELDERSHTRIDAEGQLHGEHPGKVWMAINLSVSAGFAKVADDGLQLIIEAIVSTATDVSTAGTGRIAAGCASAIFMATRHGRDVVLPRFTELDIALDRPIDISPISTTPAAGTK